MGLFSFGGSRSDSSSQSQSSSFDNMDSSGFTFGQTGSQSSGGSGSQATSRQNIAFEDVFAKLFGGASQAAGSVDTAGLTGAANLLFGSGGKFLDTLDSGGEGAGYLKDRLASRDGMADEQVGMLGDDIARFLAEDVNPAITSGGVQAGTFGGSRGEVQRGIATRGATEAFSKGSLDIRAREQQQRDALATSLSQDESGRATGALGALPSLFGLAEGGAMSGLSPFLALSQILGGPTVLTESDSSSFSQQLAEAFGLNIGANQATGRAGSQGTSSSDSSSRSFNMGFG